MMIEVEALTAEVLAMLTRVEEALAPRRMALTFCTRLAALLQQQIADAFAQEGPGWPALSEMRVKARGGSRHPMLRWGDSVGRWGSTFFDEVTHYKGEIKLRETSFDFDFPGDREVSGRYWGLAAGQLVNPLGMRPLADFPRPILGGASKQTEDSVLALASYFESHGWEVTVE